MFSTKRIQQLEARVRQLEADIQGIDKLLQAMCEADTVVQFVPCGEPGESKKKKMH